MLDFRPLAPGVKPQLPAADNLAADGRHQQPVAQLRSGLQVRFAQGRVGAFLLQPEPQLASPDAVDAVGDIGAVNLLDPSKVTRRRSDPDQDI
jgi:hypothetical protein